MEPDISHSEIDKLENELTEFTEKWESSQHLRARRWRKWVLIGFIASLLTGLIFPGFWWTGLVFVAFSAGSLFMMINQRAKTSSQINEHKKQLKLARLLLKFNATL